MSSITPNCSTVVSLLSLKKELVRQFSFWISWFSTLPKRIGDFNWLLIGVHVNGKIVGKRIGWHLFFSRMTLSNSATNNFYLISWVTRYVPIYPDNLQKIFSKRQKLKFWKSKFCTLDFLTQKNQKKFNLMPIWSVCKLSSSPFWSLRFSSLSFFSFPWLPENRSGKNQPQ